MTDMFCTDQEEPFGEIPITDAELREPSNRMQRRTLRTRKKLLSAARLLFCSYGVDATTIEEITERADVGKGTFYRYFASKEDVVLALMEDTINRLIKLLRSSKKAPQSLQEMLEQLFDVHSRFFMNRREDFLLLFQGRLLIKLQSDAISGLEDHFGCYVDEIAGQLANFLPQTLQPERAHSLAFAVIGMISGFFSFSMSATETNDLKASLKLLRHAFVFGSKAFLVDLV
jgi:AcrR family transcriptional regulator